MAKKESAFLLLLRKSGEKKKKVHKVKGGRGGRVRAEMWGGGEEHLGGGTGSQTDGYAQGDSWAAP